MKLFSGLCGSKRLQSSYNPRIRKYRTRGRVPIRFSCRRDRFHGQDASGRTRQTRQYER